MPSSTTLQHAIENITIWRKGEQRAPHKPLLLLYVLSQYQRGHARMFDYASEIRDELHSLLERFGPQRRQYQPDMPALAPERRRLLGAAQQRTVFNQGSRQPPSKELELCHVAGGFDEPHFALLNRNKKLINTLAHQILGRTFRRVFQEELAEEMGFDLLQIRKERDPHFRQQVLRAYNYECAICGFNMRHDNTSVALEAAHIKWKQHGGPCEIPNGTALCAIHHKAFDKGSIGLDEDMRIRVSPAVNGGGIVGRLFWDF